MNNPATFQALKQPYFDWLEAPERNRPALLEQLQQTLPAAQFQALLGLIQHTEQHAERPSCLSDRQIDRLGACVGPFKITARLGGGGMGEVYLAERVAGGFHQQVALKLVRSEFASRALIQRFNREREILARLSHPNIAGLIDGGLHAGLPWFAMEYVDGRPLSQYLLEQPLTRTQTLGLALQMAEALTEAHRKLVIHRDLKPANIMVTARGVVKLLDFGIGKMLDSSDPAETLAGLTPMTLRYASPEQLAGEQTSISTDIYQLGLVLSELLLGAPTRSEAELSGAAQVPIDVRAVLRQALAESPLQRYVSASEFAADLRRLIAREPVQAMPAKFGYRLQRFFARNQGFSLALVFAGIALIGGVVSSVWQARQAQHNADTVLRLLNVAAPQTFVGAEPPLSEYLINSATQLETDFATQPEFLARGLVQIANGLLNLNRPQAAQAVLLKADHAAERAGLSGERRQPILRLMAYTMDPPTPLALAQRTSKRICELLQQEPGSAGLNALASITGSLSKHLDGESVNRNLALIASLRGKLTLAPEDSENLLRQLGMIAMRQRKFEQALQHFVEADQLYAKAPQGFSSMRMAETKAFIAQAALGANKRVLAKRFWLQAQPDFVKAYRVDDAPMREFEALGAQIEP